MSEVASLLESLGCGGLPSHSIIKTSLESLVTRSDCGPSRFVLIFAPLVVRAQHGPQCHSVL